MTVLLGGKEAAKGLKDPFAPSMVERISSILDAFGLPMARLTLEEVTRRSNLPRSTTHRILEQLVQSGWIAHVGNLYSLGYKSMRLGARDIVCEELRSASNARLNELAYRTGLVVHLAAIDGSEIYYLDKFGGPGAAKVPSRVGGRAPAHRTAVGKAILAFLPPEVVHELFAEPGEQHHGHKFTDVAGLHRELAMVRARNGVAFERGESFPGIACVGTAILDTRGPVAAISVVGDLAAPLERIAPMLIGTAKAISNELVLAEAAMAADDAVA
ncbi:IclR family transcriptional regulator [Arthrobacter sp. HMWF013]|uniref:IclR family transcriptional regulator n=1 Tax=Arthrobacter sp. HMWF013 TaxID=2056849 RepID=UPI000D3795DD|nr:IclR family transcriptional regulator [Arthrobacter sp. HMWF013]PTT68008.1 IclR family transcriptional regulator [Arthrobacter sp. HMWF013]